MTLAQVKRKGQSTLPCHGCGSTDAHWTGRVCHSCAHAIKRYAEITAERAAVPESVVMLGKERAYALPHIFKAPKIVVDVIQSGFLDLQNYLSTTVEGYPAPQGRIFNAKDEYRESDWDMRVRIRSDHAKTLGETYSAVQHAITQAYADGHDTGRRLLLSLASGAITNDEFNNSAARVG